MLCYVLLCYVMLFYAALCYVMLCYVMLCCAMFCYVMLCYVMVCYITLCYVMLCYAILRYVMSCSVMLCNVMIMITLMTCNSKKKDLCAPSCETLLKIASLTDKHFSYYADWFDCYRKFNLPFSRYDWHNFINISLILHNSTIKLLLRSPKINPLALIQGIIISTAEAVSRMCSVNSILDNGTIKLTLRSPKINRLALIQGIVI